jgi:hypothetical protein
MPRTAQDLVTKHHHELIVMMPAAGSGKSLSLIGRRLYRVLLAVSQVELQGVMPLADHTFEAPLHQLLSYSAGGGEERSVAKKYFKEMQEFAVDWESTAPGDGVKWMGLNMLSQAKVMMRNGQTWVSWAFPPEIMAMVVDPDRYAVWNLRVTSQLSTYCALALYEICARYRDNPSGVTSRKPCDWWIDALSGSAPAEGKKRREWRKFKVEKINRAVEEISAETDLEIELIEHRNGGRAVEEVQFIVRKKQKVQQLTTAVAIDANLMLQAERNGIGEKAAEQLIRQFGEALFKDKLDLLAARVQNTSLARVNNTFAWLSGVLKNAHLSGESETPQTEAPEANVRNTPLNEKAPVNRSNAAIVLAEINQLPIDQRQKWVDLAVVELKAAKLFSAQDKKRSEEDKIVMGAFGGKVINLYATHVYGPEWQSALMLVHSDGHGASEFIDI